MSDDDSEKTPTPTDADSTDSDLTDAERDALHDISEREYHREWRDRAESEAWRED